MLLAVDFDEDFINIEGVAISSVLSLQSPGVQGPELDTPEANGFAGYSDAAFS